MILQGKNKTFLKSIIRYYVDTTEKAYDDFISSVTATKGVITPDMEYSDWLAVKCFDLLKGLGISLKDCIENKDTVRAAISADASRKDGEFYTPEVWCKLGREYLQRVVGDLWGTACVYDASCGTANLMKTADYPTDKLFMSTLLEEDIAMVESVLPGCNVFQCDFLSGDLDNSNISFLNSLPDNLKGVFERNEPIIIYMNPPYKVGAVDNTDVGKYMSSVTVNDLLSADSDCPDSIRNKFLTKSGLDIFHQFMFRLVQLKKYYNLTNMYLGIFGPVTMYHSKMIEPLYTIFKQEFKFSGGMCFEAGDFANTSESVGWTVGFTTWQCKGCNDEDASVLLDAKVVDLDDNISEVGKRLFKQVDINMHDWTKPDYLELSALTGVSFNDFVDLPQVTNMSNMTGKVVKMHSAALGQLMSSNFVIRATRRASVTTLPIIDGQDITEENFWRCVASYVARRAYSSMANSFNNCQYCSKPDTKVPGYDEWLVNALPIFLFDFSTQIGSYRGLDIDDGFGGIDVTNKFFPISAEIVKSVVTDEAILADIEKHSSSNTFILKVLEDSKPKMCEEAIELLYFAVETILDSLAVYKRKSNDYANHTIAWDSSLTQLRLVPGLWSDDKEKRFSYLISKLKNKLSEGVYRFGFMMDTYVDSVECDVDTTICGDSSEFDGVDLETDNEGNF